jgi:PHYB activation tagged suppressor 1
MKAEADGVELDVHDHDYLRRILPHFVKWKDQYGMFCHGMETTIFS